MNLSWKPIPGWPEYGVSLSGRVFRFGRLDSLRPSLDADGYQRVTLCARGQRKTYFVHALVLETFQRPRIDGEQCCHGDGNRSNNAAENLSWGTAKDNAADRERHGTHLRGGRSVLAKATDDEVVAALHEAKQVGVSVAAGRIGLKQAALSSIKCGLHRKHLQDRLRREGAI